MARPSTRTAAKRPMRQLSIDLGALGSIDDDVAAASAADIVRQRIAVSAETVMAVCHDGLGALGHLLAHSSPVIEDGTGVDSVEALGWSMVEIGDLAAACLMLTTKPPLYDGASQRTRVLRAGLPSVA